MRRRLPQGPAASAGAALVIAGAVASALVWLTVGATVPVWLTVGATVVVGGVVAWGAGAAYEHLVPQATREKIDEGVRDAWDATGGKVWDKVFG